MLCKKEKLLSLCSSADTAALWCWCLCWLLLLYTCKLWVNHDTATVLANDDFLSHTDVHLTLWWNLAEATCTSISLNVYDTKTVA